MGYRTAYRGLMEYMMNLRTHFKNNHPDYSLPGTLYYGYMDMTCFPLVTEKLKGKGLKIAIVLSTASRLTCRDRTP
jgi:hypothetical protein